MTEKVLDHKAQKLSFTKFSKIVVHENNNTSDRAQLSFAWKALIHTLPICKTGNIRCNHEQSHELHYHILANSQLEYSLY